MSGLNLGEGGGRGEVWGGGRGRGGPVTLGWGMGGGLSLKFNTAYLQCIPIARVSCRYYKPAAGGPGIQFAYDEREKEWEEPMESLEGVHAMRSAGSQRICISSDEEARLFQSVCRVLTCGGCTHKIAQADVVRGRR